MAMATGTDVPLPLAQLQSLFKEVVENVFNRWTALRLAVEHGMGGPLGLNTAIEIIDYITCYCTEKKNVDSIDLREVIEEIMDQEFATICEDESIYEISEILINLLNMLKNNKVENVKEELTRMGPCEIWIRSGNRIKFQSIEDSSGTEDEDMDDQDMEVGPASIGRTMGGNSMPSSQGSTTDFVEEEIDPGWTQVRNRRRR
ncbi:pre-rRNA-processing protein TSR2 homolog [Toxorhynchites rutilus septentrionalis]|uniref:pre-rRNA-processing protein TSR2 homolog n=1 Tax=Toxorhynchites rutilus septentrionalis TaxID=329112 RepID=UPI00247A1A48|nr:pre-rRNA-processing protein TSR2 homolog [Toxorhynchites rutilus septentrionalis]